MKERSGEGWRRPIKTVNAEEPDGMFKAVDQEPQVKIINRHFF